MVNEMIRDFLREELTPKLTLLRADTPAQFGLMTAQHMVEHITHTVKVTVKRYGEPPTEGPVPGEGFKRFIANGAQFKHFPSDKTSADLPKLKYERFEEATSQLPAAIDRFYHHFEAQPGFKCFNPMMGELGFSELEPFHYQHIRYHFWQFGLLEQYP